MFTVKKIHLGQWKYSGLENTTWSLPPGYAVCQDGIPIVWQSNERTLVLEVFDLKMAAEKEANYFNRHGFNKVRVLCTQA